MGMIGRPLIDQTLIALGVAQQDPACSTSKRLPGADELAPPPIDASEVALQRLVDGAARNAVTAEAIEVQLVQDHRIGGNQLLPLESVDHESRPLAEGACAALFRVAFRPPSRASVVVLPVAEDELLREPSQLRRVTGQWFRYVGHREFLLGADVESPRCSVPACS